jgi:hypothetical protein
MRAVWSFKPRWVRPLPCPSRCRWLEAEQDALVPIGEAVENALFFLPGDLPYEDPVALAIVSQELLSGFRELFFHLDDGRRIDGHPP